MLRQRKRRSMIRDKMELRAAIIRVITAEKRNWPLSDRAVHYRLLNIPGLGPKTAAKIWRELGVSTLAALVLIRFVHGSATAIFGPVASASLSDIAPAAKRGRWLSTYSTAQGAGQALGPVLAGYVIAAGRFDLAFLAAGAFGFTVPLMVARWRSGFPARSWRRT
jgi:MFS family permease